MPHKVCRWLMAAGKRPVPFRTRKLSPPAPMVLHSGGCGRVGYRRPNNFMKHPAHRKHPGVRGAFSLYPGVSVCPWCVCMPRGWCEAGFCVNGVRVSPGGAGFILSRARITTVLCLVAGNPTQYYFGLPRRGTTTVPNRATGIEMPRVCPTKGFKDPVAPITLGPQPTRNILSCTPAIRRPPSQSTRPFRPLP